MNAELMEALENRQTLILDGAMGTMLFAAGVAAPGRIGDLACLEHPQVVTDIQCRYVEAGADIITTNTFNSNALNLKKAAGDHAPTVAQMYAAAAKCARDAGARFVAGDLGPSGQMLEPYGDMEEDDAYQLFAEQARAIEAAGCDLVLLETFTDCNEAVIALRACKDNCALPVFASLSYRETGMTFMGSSAEESTRRLIDAGADVVGANCMITPDDMAPVIAAIAEAAAGRVPVLASANAGKPQHNDGNTTYDFEPEPFAVFARGLQDAGATIIGSCCGTDPRHTAAIARLLKG